MKTIIIGLVASGKTTLYRKLNEEKTSYAVEIELPQSCINDDEIKQKLFNIYYNSPNIETIIAHPYYLPQNFWELISEEDNVQILRVDKEERMSRAEARSKSYESTCKIFNNDFFDKEEAFLKMFLEH